MLIKWALERCRKDEVPAYLESTAIAGTLNQRLGFTPEEKISLTFHDGRVYEEVAYLFRPGINVGEGTT